MASNDNKGPSAKSFQNAEGVLSDMFMVKSGGYAKWSFCYLILDKSQSKLYYYSSMNDLEPNAVWDLTVCLVEPCYNPRKTDGKYGLKIRNRIFVTEDEATLNRWLDSMLGFYRPNPPPPPQALLTTRPSLEKAVTAEPVPSPAPQSDFIYLGSMGNYSTESDQRRDFARNEPTDGWSSDSQETVYPEGYFRENEKPVEPITVPLLVLTPDSPDFPVVEKPMRNTVKVGRHTGSNEPAGEERITYNSKVVSRHHAEFLSADNEVYLRDTGSSAGTFLNTMRLSMPGKESKPYKLKTGDVVQFGVDSKEPGMENAKSVTVRVEIRTTQINV